MVKKNPKPVIGYVGKDQDGILLICTAAATEQDSWVYLEQALLNLRTRLKRQGYRVVKVEIREIG